MVPRARLVSSDHRQCRCQEIGRCTADWQPTQQLINIPSVSFQSVWLCVIILEFCFHECLQRVVCDL